MISHPAWNAVLNGLSAVLLMTGYVMIRIKRVRAHKLCMLGALATSTVFLTSYLVYHWRVGSVRFPGQGLIRTFYFTLLGSHTILAVAILPLVIVTLARALRRNFTGHKKIARWTFPLWTYVSVTGVLVYVLLYAVYHAQP